MLKVEMQSCVINLAKMSVPSDLTEIVPKFVVCSLVKISKGYFRF